MRRPSHGASVAATVLAVAATLAAPHLVPAAAASALSLAPSNAATSPSFVAGERALYANDVIARVPLTLDGAAVTTASNGATPATSAWDVELSDPGLNSGQTYAAAHVALTVGPGDLEVVLSANDAAFLMLSVRTTPTGRVVKSAGVIRQHDTQPLPPDGRIYFPNYLQEGTLQSGMNKMEMEVLSFTPGSPVQATVEPVSSLELTPSDFRELSLATPSSVVPDDGRIQFDVQVEQRGVRPAVETVEAHIEGQGDLRDLTIEPVRTRTNGIGTYRVTGTAVGPGAILVQVAGGYNHPSDVVTVIDAAAVSSPSAVPIGAVLAAPILLAATLMFRNTVTHRRRMRVSRHA